jgi:hypothetical protein
MLKIALNAGIGELTMTDRERLVELLKRDPCKWPMICSADCEYEHLKDCFADRFADYLLKNGVTFSEKDVPKIVLDKSLEYDGEYGYCPECGIICHEFDNFKRCSNCGQALDWSDAK